MEVQKVTTSEVTFFVKIGGTSFEAKVNPASEELDEAEHVTLSVKRSGWDEERSEEKELDYGLTLEEAKALRKSLTAAIRHLEDAEDE